MRKFAKRSFEGSTQIVQTMGETCSARGSSGRSIWKAVMRERMSRAIRTVERSANRIAAGGGLATMLADTLAGFAIAFAIFYGSWRVAVQHADVGAFASFLGALLLAYEPAKRLGALPGRHAERPRRRRADLRGARRAARATRARPDLPPLEGHAGAGCVSKQVRFGYRAGRGGDSRPRSHRRAQPDDGAGRAFGRRQVDDSRADPALLRAQRGRILIDGQDIAEVDLASLRDRIAFVSQDVFLFRGTIRDNIALGKPGATEVEIVAAARKAHAHDFILQFADGYDTNVGEQGAQLSGGQRQRVAIARAILKDAPILLLDEPTAALDSESEREVQKALDALRQGRTTMVVAHRLQTIIGADRIYVIENGRAVESGSHARTDRARRRLSRLLRRPVRSVASLKSLA